jgi:hypothetical protein
MRILDDVFKLSGSTILRMSVKSPKGSNNIYRMSNNIYRMFGSSRSIANVSGCALIPERQLSRSEKKR